VPYLLAWANDAGYGAIFKQQLRNLAEEGDLAIAISCSGNSSNVLRAINYANATNMVTIGMTGFDGGQVRKIVHHCIHIPIEEMGMESIHLIILHYIVNSLKKRLFIEKRS
jgi:D-sedoheptulose 7-phosphate isomerase